MASVAAAGGQLLAQRRDLHQLGAGPVAEQRVLDLAGGRTAADGGEVHHQDAREAGLHRAAPARTEGAAVAALARQAFAAERGQRPGRDHALALGAAAGGLVVGLLGGLGAAGLRQHRTERLAGEHLELAADAGVDDRPAHRPGDRFGLAVGLDHLVDLRVVPAEALAEVVRVEVVGIVRLHVEDADAVVGGLGDVGGEHVVRVDADEVDLLEAEIVRELQHGEGDGAAGIGDLGGVGGEVEPVRIADPRAVVEEERVRRFIEAVAQVRREELRGALEGVDPVGPVLGDEMVLDHEEGGQPVEVGGLEEEGVHREGDLVLQHGEVGAVEARPVADDEAALAAAEHLAQRPEARPVDAVEAPLVDLERLERAGDALLEGELLGADVDRRAHRQQGERLVVDRFELGARGARKVKADQPRIGIDLVAHNLLVRSIGMGSQDRCFKTSRVR